MIAVIGVFNSWAKLPSSCLCAWFTEEKVNVCKAIQGIEERGRAAGIQIGAEHEQRLTKSLLKDNRIDDLKRALDDPAFRQKLLEEYGID